MSDSNRREEGQPEFYVGYLDEAPPGLARFVRRSVFSLMGVSALVAGLLATTQGDFGWGAFEFGVTTTLEGRVILEPFPALLVNRVGGPPSHYLLVAEGKFGADELAEPWDGRRVQIEGTLIYRDGRTMVEVPQDGIAALDDSVVSREPLRWTDLDSRTFVGEIVDSKCYLGVMKPGSTKPHRACATRCLSGGIPPVLLVRDEEGLASYLMLVSESGEPIGARIVERDLVAEPVRVRGAVQRVGDSFVLRTDPESIERLSETAEVSL